MSRLEYLERVAAINGSQADTYRDLCDQLKDENAELRELVRWMYDRMDESCAVQHPYVPAPIRYDHLMQALARARELGVEVEGWPR